MNSTVDIPLNEKKYLTLKQAAAYFNIGIHKVREVTNRDECAPFVLFVGNKRLISREGFEQYLASTQSI